MSKKDHIALPAQSLRRFREKEQDKFYFLDVVTGVIDSKGPSVYQRKYGYYQEYYDTKVQELENILGKIAEIVIPIAECDEQDATYDREWLKNIAIRLISMQIHRRPEMKDTAMEADRLRSLIDKTEASIFQQGAINIDVINRSKQLRKMLDTEKSRRDYFYEKTDIGLSNIVSKLGLHELGATFLKVPAEIMSTFLLTPYHFIQSGRAWLFTIAPRLAIALLPAERFNDSSNQCGIWEIENEEDIELLTPRCIKMAKQSNPPHLIGERYTLEKIKPYLSSGL